MCALRLDDVVETMRALPVEPISGTPPFVLGLSVIRGAAVPVVDPPRLNGVRGEPNPSRYVTIKVEERRVALAVDDVLGIRTLPAAELEEVPPLLREADSAAISALGALDAQLLLVLKTARILPDSAWTAIDARALA